MRRAYADGIAWGDAKHLLFERIDQDVAPMRKQYQALMADPTKIEAILQAGASKAIALSAPFMSELRHAVGLRKLAVSIPASLPKAAKVALPSFKQYREADGQFYFKLFSAENKLLVQSLGFASGKEAAMAITTLQQQGAAAWPAMQIKVQTLSGTTPNEVEKALEHLMDDHKNTSVKNHQVL